LLRRVGKLVDGVRVSPDEDLGDKALL